MKPTEINDVEMVAPEPGPLAAAERAGDAAYLNHQHERLAHWNRVAHWRATHKGRGGAYRRRLKELYRFYVPRGARVLEIGCAEGDLLAAVAPAVGVGVDFSAEMIARARSKHPTLRFVRADAHALELDEKFDIIILSDVINEFWDAQRVLELCARLSTLQTRLIINLPNRLWKLPLTVARPRHNRSWLRIADVNLLLTLAGFEVIRHKREALLPLPLPLLSTFANRYLVKLWPFSLLAATHLLIARPTNLRPQNTEPLVSVIIPARDEAGNIADIFAAMPEMGAGTEMVFVEGGSRDQTYEVIEQLLAQHPEQRCQLLRQTGKGKVDAVRLGFAHARGEVLMIFDADLTVPPADLPRYLEVLVSGQADFANPSRLVYAMEDEAMRFFNLLGNKFFGHALSWLLDQPFKDALCGTKVLWKKDYERIAAGRHYFGDFDPFGEFDLLFGATKLNLKIMDVPVRHRRRLYGTTKIPRWHGGVQLLRMVLHAARRIKFI